jgi:hypothetical protein
VEEEEEEMDNSLKTSSDYSNSVSKPRRYRHHPTDFVFLMYVSQKYSLLVLTITVYSRSNYRY